MLDKCKDYIWNIISCYSIVGYLSTRKTLVNDHEFTIVFKSQSDWFHSSATRRLSVTRSIIDVFRPQA